LRYAPNYNVLAVLLAVLSLLILVLAKVRPNASVIAPAKTPIVALVPSPLVPATTLGLTKAESRSSPKGADSAISMLDFPATQSAVNEREVKLLYAFQKKNAGAGYRNYSYQ
jgi:hypothetical protein